jgi:hypothetical protein
MVERTPVVTLREALADPLLLGNAIAGDSWKPWRTLLLASQGEALTDDERVLFKQLTQREHEPNQPVEEFVGVIGRRGGKSRAISVVATYIAALRQHPALAPGETGIVLIIAPDTRQATICLDYITAHFQASPILKQLVEQRTQSELRLANGVEIHTRASDFRRLRGPSYLLVIGDESSFYVANENSSNPADEIFAACRPGLSTTAGQLFMISSPYSRKGPVWDAFKQNFGANGDPKILVAQASSRIMNATLRQSVVDRAYERDPISASAEYGAEFRRDIESFISLEAVLACVDQGVTEIPKIPYKVMSAFADPSAGASDSFAMAIGYGDVESKQLVVCAIREVKPPFSPAAVVEEFANLCKVYGISKITADKFAGEFPRELFSKHGIRYESSARPKSDLYCDLLAAINSKRVRLLDHPRLVQQLIGLERRVARSGKFSIDHAPGGFDDIANVVAGLCAAVLGKYPGYDSTYQGWNDYRAGGQAADNWQRARLQNYLRTNGGYGWP